MKKIKNKRIFILIFFLLMPVFARAMSSSNYSIDSDVIGSFGGPSSSDNFSISDTGGEVGTGGSASATYEILAGFWSSLSGGTISMSCPDSVTMGPITGVGQSDLSTNSIACNIKTDSVTGYKLDWAAGSATMNSGSDTIAAYSPAVADTPETWSVDAADSEWGAHLGAGSTTADTDMWGIADTYAGGKWLDIATNPFMVIDRHSATDPAGDDEVIFFGSEIGSNKFQPTGSYSVNVTMTATIL
ncbi:MAG: hypothetical protein WC120_05995 [Parcubacteria group bacterium]